MTVLYAWVVRLGFVLSHSSLVWTLQERPIVLQRLAIGFVMRRLCAGSDVCICTAVVGSKILAALDRVELSTWIIERKTYRVSLACM